MQTAVNGGDSCCINIPAVLSIKGKLSKLSISQSDYFIFRVHSQLRIGNEKCYEPEIISIGPYHRHHREDKMKVMEERKLYYLQSLLERRGESVDRYYNAIKDLEEEARKHYAELPEMNSQEFIEMMLLDGCFIIELFRKVDNPSLVDGKDPIFKMNWLRNALERDLMLFENQIPFFVLDELFRMSDHLQETTKGNKDLIKLAMNFFHSLTPGNGYPASSRVDWSDKTKHLLQVIYHNWLPSFTERKKILAHDKKWDLIQCASELVESGVKFKKASNESCLFDISFTNGTLEIPCITIENRTECFLRNLVAYEEYYQDIRDSHIICYVKFLDCLIQSPKDVEILCQYGIINNWLGDDEAISNIFNKINYRVTAPIEGFKYSDIFNEVNAYCNKRPNRWMAKLKKRYLNSPWAVISVFAGFTLLLLSLIQTTFSVLTYKYEP